MTPNARYKHYAVGILLLIYTWNMIDRAALGLLLQEIKVDLDLSDTQLGLLTGLAFALFYSIMGVPIARWADRGNRIHVIALSSALCGVAVSTCGLAAGFIQLLMIRVVVGIGEAGCKPPALSLIADYFARADRPRAVAFYSLAAPLSLVAGYFLTGWLNALYGWRVTFMLLGLPSLALALIAGVSLRETRSGPVNAAAPAAVEADPPPSLANVTRHLLASPACRHIFIAYTILNLLVYGVTQWQPTFFIRSHGLSTAQLGNLFAIVYGLGGLTGVLAGGHWASRRRHREALHLATCARFYCLIGLISPAIYLVPSPYLALSLVGIVAFGYFFTFPPTVAAIQTMVPARMRATTFALLYLFVNLIGIGLGPLVIGIVSDALRPRFGENSLAIALLALTPGYFWIAFHVWRASRTVETDIAGQEHEEASTTGGPPARDGRSAPDGFQVANP